MKIESLEFCLIAKIKLDTRFLILRPIDIFYGMIDVDGNVLSFLSSSEEKANKVKIRANYTVPEHRNKGYFTNLLKWYVKPRIEYKANALKPSRNIYIRNGFEEYNIKEFKSFTVYYMRKTPC